jgi:hypothetical protein
MNLEKLIVIALIGGGIAVFILGLLGDMDIIPKFSQWEGIPLNIIGALMILGGIGFIVLLGVGKSGLSSMFPKL